MLHKIKDIKICVSFCAQYNTCCTHLPATQKKNPRPNLRQTFGSPRLGPLRMYVEWLGKVLGETGSENSGSDSNTNSDDEIILLPLFLLLLLMMMMIMTLLLLILFLKRFFNTK